MEVLSYITLFMYLGFCHGVNTRRKLTILQQDVETLRYLAVDLRHDIDDLYTWRNVTFASSHDTSVLASEDKVDTVNKKAFGDDDKLIRSFEKSLKAMDGRVAYIIKGLAEEKMALRKMLEVISAEIQQEVVNIQTSVDNTIHDTDETRKLAEITNEAHQALFSNLTDKLEMLDQHITVRLDNIESQCRKVSKDAKTSIDDIWSQLNRVSEKQYDMSMKLDGWQRHGGFFYKLFTTKVTFSTAVKRCEDLDASLVTYPDMAEMEFLIDNFGSEFFWLGATDRQTEGVWRWLDGRTMTGGNWSPGQPDNYRNNEDCLMTGAKYRSRMNDWPCADKMNYVCKKQ